MNTAPAIAMQLLPLLHREDDVASVDVLAAGDQLQVIRVHTGRDAAQVIKVHTAARGKRSAVHLVRQAVRVQDRAASAA